MNNKKPSQQYDISKKVIKMTVVNFSNILSTEINHAITKPAITCSKVTIGTLEEGVKYVQS